LEKAVPLAEAVRQASQQMRPPLLLMPWEEASESTLKTVLRETNPQAVAVFIGPEGGFTADEAEIARQAGVRLVKLGPRILRAESAGLAVCAVILYELGEWNPL
jgi:16S rRNA (uracil1498-N3)-methyltransferase